MYFDTYDIVQAYYLFFEQNYSWMFHPNYIRRCRMEKYFRPDMFLSYENLNENGQAIYDNLVSKDFISRGY